MHEKNCHYRVVPMAVLVVKMGVNQPEWPIIGKSASRCLPWTWRAFGEFFHWEMRIFCEEKSFGGLSQGDHEAS